MATINAAGAHTLHHDPRRQTIASNKPLASPAELMELLMNWATEKGIGDKLVDNIQTIWNLINVLGLRQPTKLLEILEPVSDVCKTEATQERMHVTYYGQLPLTLDTYIIEQMVINSANLTNVDARMKAFETENDGDELLRYKIRVVRDTFLWLEELLERWGDWVQLLIADGDDRKRPEMREQLARFSDTDVREFEQRSRKVTVLGGAEVLAVNKLWEMFEGNERVPVRFAFCLGRLKVAGRWKAAAWPRLNGIASMLQ